jgi:hypothetical protein
MQLNRRVVRTRSAHALENAATPAEPASRDWIEGGVSERHARTRFDLVLSALARVEGTRHDGWQPIVARHVEGAKEVSR